MNEAKTSIINLRPEMTDESVDVKKIEEICDNLGYSFAMCKKGNLVGSHSKIDIILDKGGYGWEPSLYILAHNPLELIDRTHQIAGHLEVLSVQIRALLCSLFVISLSLAGCLDTESSSECEDGTLDILTYDILALSDDLIDQFSVESGYCVNFIKEDDSGGILDKMMLTKG